MPIFSPLFHFSRAVNMGDKVKQRLTREYGGSSEAHVSRTPRGDALDPVAVQVLNKYFVAFRRSPDAAGLSILADTLNVPGKTISDWFESNQNDAN